MVSTLPTISGIIVISIKPLVKLIIPVLSAGLLTRAGLLTKAGAKSLAQIVLNITLPALLFSKIIPAFNATNISALPIIVLAALFYIGFGLVSGLISRWIIPPPARFHNGFISALMFSNWGDLPLGVIVAVTSASPFSSGDSDLAVAYISVFILVFYITLFPMRGTYFIRRDYTHPHIQSNQSFSQRISNLRKRVKKSADVESEEDTEKDHKSISTPKSTTSSESIPLSLPKLEIKNLASHRRTFKNVMITILLFMRSLLTPPTTALLVSLLIALIPKLKILFISTTPTLPPLGIAPTLPPLGIILDTATFIGQASVPSGLFILGSALSRLKLPRPYSKLPWSSMLCLASLKLLILPVLGYVFTKAMTRAGMIKEEEKVLQFVIIYFSIVPTSTTQVALSEVYSVEGEENNSEILAGYLVVQYFVFAFASVFLTVITLTNLFG